MKYIIVALSVTLVLSVLRLGDYESAVIAALVGILAAQQIINQKE